jgi:precorrin-6Y C5,15-methyltransferase (decarboxylating)
MPYHDLRIVSLTGRPWMEFDRALIERAPKIGVLTDREHTPAAIAQRMMDYGYTYYQMFVGEHLGNPSREKVSQLTLEEAAKGEYEMPNCLILNGCGDMSPRHFGISEKAFALLDGREKMITKAPIRLLTLSALELQNKHSFWDIGFCTGSVSIEARLLFPRLRITAFEIREEGRQLMLTNSRRFGAPGIETVIGDFFSLPLSQTLKPDAIFIGGHGGRLPEMMRKACDWLLPGGVIVYNCVSPDAVTDPRIRTDSRQLFEQTARECGLRLEPALHVAVNDHHPIDILKARKQ